MPPTAVASTVPAHVQAPAPAPAPVEVKKQDISSAFSSFDDPVVASTASSSSNAVGNSGSVADDADIRNSLDAMKAATKKTVAAHEQAVEINGKAYSSLHGIKQRLATDRIALEATVANAIVANNECNAKLEQVSSEIQQLQEQIRQLTAKLQETSQNTSSSQVIRCNSRMWYLVLMLRVCSVESFSESSGGEAAAPARDRPTVATNRSLARRQFTAD